MTRRGLAPPAGFIGHCTVSSRATARVPAALVKATVEAVASRAVDVSVRSLVERVLRAMLMSRIKLVVLFVLATGSLAGILLPLTLAQVGKPGPPRRGEDSRPGDPSNDMQKTPSTDTARDVGTVFFRVVDQETKQPLSGVVLKVWVNGKVARQHTTDDSGRTVIPLREKEFERLTITASGNRLVPMRVYLRHFAARETEIPRSYTLAMQRGTSIGGNVQDEQGRPIVGATVAFYETSPEDRGGEAVDFNEITAKTDAQGHWRVDLIPANLDLGHLHIRYSHPKFLSPRDYIDAQPLERPDQLRQQSAVTILRTGITVTGRALDSDGHPIAGASVRLGEKFDLPTAKTDATGLFQIDSATPGKSLLTVQAPGHSPEMKSVFIQIDLPLVEFRLGPPHTIRGRVVDAQGRAVAGAIVGALHWRGHQVLDSRGHRRRGPVPLGRCSERRCRFERE